MICHRADRDFRLTDAHGHVMQKILKFLAGSSEFCVTDLTC
jgi:hypothetical protein